FVRVIDAITAFTDTNRNAVVVLACLEDYFKANIERLTRSKYDRLMRDPEPVRLLGNRTREEIRQMASKRLGYLYDMADVEVDQANDLYPFRDEHLRPLDGMRSRDALNFLQRHHQCCITRAAGKNQGRKNQGRSPLPHPFRRPHESWIQLGMISILHSRRQ